MAIYLVFAVCYVAATVLPYMGARYLLAPANNHNHPLARLLGFFACCMGPICFSNFACSLFVGVEPSVQVANLLQVGIMLIVLPSMLTGFFLGHRRRAD